MSQPPVTYHRARSSRRAFLLGGVLALFVAGGAGLAFGTELFFDDSAESATPQTVIVNGSPVELDSRASRLGDAEIGASSVAVIGDSITQGSADAIRYTLGSMGVTEIVVDGVTSRRIEQGDGRGAPLSGTRALAAMLADGADPDVWVIALGTNDVGQYATEDEYRALVRSIIGMLPDDVPLVWVDVFRHDRLDHTAMFNGVVRDEVADHDDSVVVSWFDVASRADQTVLRSDDIHPNADGTVVFAALVADGVAAVS